MIENRKARHEYTILEEYKTGMVLVGSEVKSIRDGKASIAESYCVLINGELFIRNMNIEPYEKAQTPHEVRRDRKLLLKKQELKRIGNKMIDKGLAIVPLRIFEDGGIFKMQIAIGKGKKLYDKRQTIKDRDISRDLARNT